MGEQSQILGHYWGGRRGEGASQVAQVVKNLPAMQDTQVRFLSWADPLKKGMATNYGFHGQRSQAGYSLWDHQESDTTEQTIYEGNNYVRIGGVG